MQGIEFQSIGASSGVRIADEVGTERTELRFLTSREWTRTEPAAFPFPVSAGVETTLAGFDLEPFSTVYVRDRTGQALVGVTPGDSHDLPAQEYCLELCTPVKTYLRFSGAATVEATTERARVRFDGDTPVEIFARSLRPRPRETVTTTGDPEDVMAALSRLGVGIRTASPSRSYVTMRGYPPLVELGAERSVPDGADSDAGPDVTLEVPSSLEYVYPAASLAYYLDATMRPGPEPVLFVDGEAVAELEAREYHDEIERLLQRVFFLDCLVRTVGHYPIESHAYRRLADDLPFSVGEVYDADLADRIREYLSVPYDLLEPELPRWPVTAHVEPDAENVGALPHLAYQLAFVRTRRPDRLSGAAARRASVQSFMRPYDGGRTRIAHDVFESDASFVEVPAGPRSDADVWVGEDVPLGANKLLAAGYEHRLRRDPVEATSISVRIVCNEGWMDDEASVSSDRYDDRADLPFEIDVAEGLDRDGLARVLESEADLLHYIGHATREGLKCRDGYLDVDSVAGVGPDMFLLNACQSYQPGLDLVRNGCLGGIVTLSEVTDAEAATVGRTLSRLLNLGFPLRDALLVARRRSIVGGQYLAVGDDSAPLVQAESGVPYECVVRTSGQGYDLSLRSYLTEGYHLGTLFRPNVGDGEQRYLAGKRIGPFDVSGAELAAFLELENAPVRFDGEFYWAFDLASELR